MSITSSKGKIIKGLPGSSLVSFYGDRLPDVTFKVVEIVRPKFKKKILNKGHKENDYYIKFKENTDSNVTVAAIKDNHFLFELEKASIQKFTGKQVKIVSQFNEKSGQTVSLELI